MRKADAAPSASKTNHFVAFRPQAPSRHLLAIPSQPTCWACALAAPAFSERDVPRSAVESASIIRSIRRRSASPSERPLQQRFDPPGLVVTKLPNRLFNHRADPLDPRSQLPFRLNHNCPKRLDRSSAATERYTACEPERVEPFVAQRLIHVAERLAKLREAIRPALQKRHGNHSPTRASLASIRLIHDLTTN